MKPYRPDRILSIFILAAAIGISTESWANDDNAITVVAGGRSDYVIAVAEDEGNLSDRIQEAATFLQVLIHEATGVKLPVMAESAREAGRPALILGRSATAREAGLAVDAVRGWSYLNRVVGNDVLLIAEDRHSPIDTTGLIRWQHPQGTRGTLKAVTAFAQSQMGVRFFLPGVNGRHVPTLERLTVPTDWEEEWSPEFFLSGAAAAFLEIRARTLDDRAYAVANHLLGHMGIYRDYGGHSYYDAVPAERYGESNPEYFALLGGIRTPQGNHLCISNPDVQELMIREAGKWIEQGFQMVEIGQTDGYQPCECDECRALHANPGEALWIVHRKIAEEVQRRWPDGKLLLLEYRPSMGPPTSFEDFPENVGIISVAYRPEHYRQWHAFDPWIAGRVPWFSAWATLVPQLSPRVAIRFVRMFREYNVPGIYVANGFDGWPGTPYGLAGPGYYAFLRALHDPDAEAHVLEAEYVDRLFQEAAAPMRAFFGALHDRTDAFWTFFRRYPAMGDIHVPIHPVMFYFDANTLNMMTNALERAQRIATTDSVKARLELVEAEFSYFKALSTVLHLYQNYRLTPNWEMIAQLEQSIRAFHENVDRLFPDGNPISPEGLRPIFAGFLNPQRIRDSRDLRQAPFTWDFNALRENNVLPGVGMSSLRVTRVEPFDIDGRLDKPVWANIEPTELVEIGLGATDRRSSFKLAYDDTYLYVGFRADMQSPTMLDYLVPVGRDGATWDQENMEIVIDPTGERILHYQFALNPIPNSTYERRFNYYHDDPDHPLYGRAEANWQGEWDYEARIDPENLEWTAEVRIPFATLEAEPPTPGTMWTLNVGRTTWDEGVERRGGSNDLLMIWAPNIETRSFHDRHTFGEVTFE